MKKKQTYNIEKTFKDAVLKAIKDHPYVLSNLGVKTFNDIDSVELAGATELARDYNQVA